MGRITERFIARKRIDKSMSVVRRVAERRIAKRRIELRRIPKRRIV